MMDFLDKGIGILALLYTIISHEIAHGLVAYWNGDPTAKNAGRLSLNPLIHLDLFGTLCLIVFKFGWAKPVPIDERNFKNRRVGLFAVSIAGITTNLISAVIAILLIILLADKNAYLYSFFSYVAIYGIYFAIFNLLPIPPLDGSKILASFLPVNFEIFIYKYERIFNLLLILLLYMGIVSKFLAPLAGNILFNVFNFFQHLI
ncbi:site-2 protease family protein [Peptoniphilaceae bacterium SGI.131]